MSTIATLTLGASLRPTSRYSRCRRSCH
jgi:hypothetical protein